MEGKSCQPSPASEVELDNSAAVAEILAQRFTASIPELSQRAVTLLLGHSRLPLALGCPRPHSQHPGH